MQFAAGQTYLFPLIDEQSAHLWVIVTDPDKDGFVLVVSLTSLKGSKDQTVILNGGEHPFLKWATCVAYSLSDLMACEQLERHILHGRAKMREPMRASIATLILDGFTASPYVKKRIVNYVRTYQRARPMNASIPFPS